MAAYNLQLKRKTASALENVYVSTKWELVDGKPSWIGSNKPSYTWSEIGSKPTSFNPSSHSHGNITNDGKIGTTANRVIVTGTGGILTAKAAGTTSQFLRGDGNWATPTASANQSADYTWTGLHTFDQRPGNSRPLKLLTSFGALPRINATIDTPEGSYDRWWEFPNQSGKLALEGSNGGESYSSHSYADTIAENTGTVQFTVAQNTKFLEVTLHRYGVVRGRIFLSIDDFDWNMWMGWIDLTGIGAITYLGARTFEVLNPGDATYVSWTEHRWG